MARPRRGSGPLFAALLLLAGLTVAHGSLMAIDLGSEYLRAVLVKPTARGSPLQIVVNEMSRRKSPALVGLAGEDRLLGEEAFSFAIRYPTTVFARARDMLGRSTSDPFVQNILSSDLLPYELVDHPERKTVMAKVNETAAFLAEELVAGVLQYAKQITDAQAGGPIVDAVITVPAWFGIEQRQALKDAASLAGINVLALVNSHSAAALQYGIERDFAAKEQKVIFYDMGSSSTEVALVKYSTYSSKEPGSSKPKPVNQFEVLDADWDAELGSAALDRLLLDHFADEFAEKTGLGDVRKHPKAIAKLKRQVRRTKEILSANSDAPFSVEELHEGRDFQSKVSRADFEALAEKAGFWKRAAAPLERLLKRNGLKGSDVDAVEVLGGGSRVPRVQAALTEVLGGRALDRHLDADEAVVLGGALFAANLSTSFRLRKFGMTDVAMYGVTWASEDLAGAAHADDSEECAKDKDCKVPSGPLLKNLLPAGKKLPIKRAIKFNNLTVDGFSFVLEYNTSAPHGLPPGRVGGPFIAEYAVSGISRAVERYNHSGVTSMKFEADWSGLVNLDKAECLVEAEVIEEETIYVPAEEGDSNDTDTKEGDAKDTAKDKEGAKDKEAADAKGKKSKKDEKKEEKKEEKGKGKKGKDEKEEKEEGDKEEKGKDEKEKKAPKLVPKKVKVPKRKTFHVALKVSVPRSSLPPLTGAVLTAAQANVTAFVLREAVKRETARAKNDLESYIIATRESLEDDGVIEVTTDEMRSSFREALMDAEDWIYGDGESEAAAGFRKKLSELRAVGNPIARRAAERKARPEAVAAARKAADDALAIAKAWAETKSWINETDAAEVVEKLEAFKTWLQEQEDAQSKKAGHEEPAFESLDVLYKWEAVSKAFTKLNSKRKPRPPKVKAEANATDAKAGEGAAKAGEGEAKGDKAEQQEEGAEEGGPEQQQAEEGKGEEGAAAEGEEEEQPSAREEL